MSLATILLSTSILYVLADAAPSGTNAVVYNHVGAKRTPLDDLVHEHFEHLRRVVDVSDKEHIYLYPHGVGARAPTNGSVYYQGQCISGSVLILYVIELDGSVVLPFVARSGHPALSSAALVRVGTLRFRPALVDGKTVATVAATRYRFRCPEPGR
jgi:hypothetical protein